MTDTLDELTQDQINRAFADACEEEWTRGIDAFTPDGELRITDYFDALGWRWSLERAGVDQYTEAARRANPTLLNYCGIGPAFVARYLLGDHLIDGVCVPVGLRRDVASDVLPSTWRMVSHRENDSRWPDDITPPKTADEWGEGDIQRGVLLTVETTSGKWYGTHFAVALGPAEDGFVETLEWNATGEVYGRGQGRGCVKRQREVADVRCVYEIERGWLDG